MEEEDGSEDSHGSASGDSDDCMDGFDSEGPAREMKIGHNGVVRGCIMTLSGLDRHRRLRVERI
jgi:hypothetical protein